VQSASTIPSIFISEGRSCSVEVEKSGETAAKSDARHWFSFWCKQAKISRALSGLLRARGGI
jgi:hypothetical protein